MSLAANLRDRLRLLRTALTRRFIWADLTTMVKAHGFELRDIRANTHPLRFARDNSGANFTPPPDFTKRVNAPEPLFAITDSIVVVFCG